MKLFLTLVIFGYAIQASAEEDWVSLQYAADTKVEVSVKESEVDIGADELFPIKLVSFKVTGSFPYKAFKVFPSVWSDDQKNFYISVTADISDLTSVTRFNESITLDVNSHQLINVYLLKAAEGLPPSVPQIEFLGNF